MPDTIQQQLVTALITRLQAMEPPDYEYEYNYIGEWRATPLRESEFPAIVVRDVGIDASKDNAFSSVQTNYLLMQIEIAVSSVAPSALRKMIADVNKAIAVDVQWGCKAFATLPVKERIVTDQDGVRILGALIEFKIAFISETFNSYQ